MEFRAPMILTFALLIALLVHWQPTMKFLTMYTFAITFI